MSKSDVDWLGGRSKWLLGVSDLIVAEKDGVGK
jgi:hypothetical protein